MTRGPKRSDLPKLEVSFFSEFLEVVARGAKEGIKPRNKKKIAIEGGVGRARGLGHTCVTHTKRNLLIQVNR